MHGRLVLSLATRQEGEVSDQTDVRARVRSLDCWNYSWTDAMRPFTALSLWLGVALGIASARGAFLYPSTESLRKEGYYS